MPVKSSPTSGGTVSISDARKRVVERARQGWIRKLIDLSRRNNLLYYRPLKTGTLDLSNAPTDKIAELLSGETVSVSKLLDEPRDESTLTVLRDIARRALANSEEKGLHTLFVAFGMASWPSDDGGRPSEAAVLLLPVVLSTKGHGTQSFQIARTGVVQSNLVLLHVLETQFGVEAGDEPVSSQGDDGEPFDPNVVFAELRKRAVEIKGFEIKPCAILGNFAFQKRARVKDLQERASDLAEHDIVAAVAGDTDARSAVGATQVDLDPKDLDRTPPENEFAVLDADSSQQCAIAGVIAGQSTVIHGPPGTGKSQTIANLITTLGAVGKRVLFVAEKRAALDVVRRRLNDVGLGHLAIDLHGADLSSKKVMQQVARTLDVVRSSVPVDCEKTHAQLAERRSRLNAHVERIHTRREPTELSVYAMQAQLLSLGAHITSSTRWRGPELARLTPAVAQRVKDLLVEAEGFASLFLRTDPSPWTGAQLPDGDAVRHGLDLVRQIFDDTLPSALSSLHKMKANAGVKWPSSVAQICEIVDLFRDVLQTTAKYSYDLYRQDFEALLRDLSPGKHGGVAAVWAWCTSGDYRRARRMALGLSG